jgi:glycosyltransferase involved in cell wall biosynthesis
MTVWLALAIACFLLACIPATIFASNLRAFQTLIPHRPEKLHEPLSVLVPARNEAHGIADALKSVLSNRGIGYEVLVLDDHSTDDTREIVDAIAQRDDRVRLISAPPLPEGWCGKQHACQILAEHARYATLIWIDADVRLADSALLGFADELASNPAALISGFPFERTETPLETLLIPLIHFILLSFLPLRQMRTSLSPALGAGCGQLFIARKADYFAMGGHAAIRASLHDGIALPRAFRRAGKTTDIFDASDLAECRMYTSASAVWNGLLKNAGEGIATPVGILPWTLLLFGGQVLPAILTIYLLARHRSEHLAILLLAVAWSLGIWIRMVSANRFYNRSNGWAKYLSALAHSLGVVILLLIQWQSLLRGISGRRSSWKGRSY